ncbi:NAD(P)-binding protein, partial [Colletotrichum scovillei]
MKMAPLSMSPDLAKMFETALARHAPKKRARGDDCPLHPALVCPFLQVFLDPYGVLVVWEIGNCGVRRQGSEVAGDKMLDRASLDGGVDQLVLVWPSRGVDGGDDGILAAEGV